MDKTVIMISLRSSDDQKCTQIIAMRSHCDYSWLVFEYSRRETMSRADTYVRARIDSDTKERATRALDAMGLSVSDVIRILMLRIADENRLPFDVRVPNS